MTKVGDEVFVKWAFGQSRTKAEVLAIDGENVTVRMSGTGRRKVVKASKIQGFRGEEPETIVPPAPKTRAERRAALRMPTLPPGPIQVFVDDVVERRPLRAVPKPKKPARSERYLDFVRDKPCCSCAAPGPSDPHHVGRRGMGQKTDDFRTTPHCRRCHDHYHDHGALPGMNAAATKTFILAKQVDLLVEFLRCELESPRRSWGGHNRVSPHPLWRVPIPPHARRFCPTSSSSTTSRASPPSATTVETFAHVPRCAALIEHQGAPCPAY